MEYDFFVLKEKTCSVESLVNEREVNFYHKKKQSIKKYTFLKISNV